MACDSAKIGKNINKENIEKAKHQRLANVLSSAFLHEKRGEHISPDESSPIVDMIQCYLKIKYISEINAFEIAKRIRAAVYAGYFLPANELDVADYTDNLGIWAAFSPEELMQGLVAEDDKQFFDKAHNSNNALLERLELIKTTRNNVTKLKDS